MKDAYGGIVNLVFIALFLLILSCIFGLIVSYTKAFKMKNNVISVIERYEGSGCSCNGAGSCTGSGTECRSKIVEGAKRLGYAPVDIKCPANYDNVDDLFCVKQIVSRPKDENHNIRYTYDVITQVDINFSLVSSIFGFNVFKMLLLATFLSLLIFLSVLSILFNANTETVLSVEQFESILLLPIYPNLIPIFSPIVIM